MFKDGKTLLVTASEKKWEEATVVLIENGADFTDNNAVNDQKYIKKTILG